MNIMGIGVQTNKFPSRRQTAAVQPLKTENRKCKRTAVDKIIGRKLSLQEAVIKSKTL